MGGRWMAWLALAGMGFAISAARAEGADHYRGGWRTDAGAPNIYQFVIHGAGVTGFHCTRCADGTTLAPIDGTFDPAKGVSFRVRHLKDDGSPAFADRLHAQLVGGRLIITGQGGGPGGGPIRQVAIKDPRGPAPGPIPQAVLPPGAPPVPVKSGGGGGGGAPPPYAAPGAWRRLSAADVVGVWIGFGVGMDKQLFIIRRDGDGLFGLACGRCDNPYTFGALDHFRFHDDVVEFDIEHQDWGEGTVLPFARHVAAHIALNELRMDARRPDQPDQPPIVASLIGPIAIAATAGNVVRD